MTPWKIAIIVVFIFLCAFLGAIVPPHIQFAVGWIGGSICGIMTMFFARKLS